MLNPNEVKVLQELAKKYAEVASLPAQDVKRKMWIRHNTLQSGRPMILVDQIPWNEMDVDGSLICQVKDPYWHEVEENMRRTLYKWEHMPADMVIDPYICLPRPISCTGWGLEAKNSHHIILEENATASSSAFINQIEEPEDLEKIHTPIFSLDKDAEAKLIEQATEIFDGIIDFKLVGEIMHLGIWDRISEWMGVTNCYIELLDRPEMIHALMEKLTQGLISMIHQLNEMEGFDLFTNMCHCSHTYLPDLPKPEDHALSGNVWAFGLAQLFTSVSPEVTKEFEVDYMKRVFPYFGAIYYGCCDRLDDRMDYIRLLPKIRKLSCSPWSVREHFAETMPDYCVMSNKPNPAFLASGHLNEDIVRADLRRTIAAAKKYNRNLEMIQKDISTVSHKPECVWRWQQIAMEEAERCM